MRLLAALLFIASCQKADGAAPPAPKPAPAPAVAKPVQTDIAAEDYVMPALPMGRVTLDDAFGGKHVVEVEVAATHDARTRGLMWRKELAEGKGMLFIFAGEQRLTFWMRNTLIPLDMVFIDKNLKVVGTVERAEPKTMSSRGVGGDSQFVLEVPGGWTSKIGLKAGSVVKLDGMAELKPEP